MFSLLTKLSALSVLGIVAILAPVKAQLTTNITCTNNFTGGIDCDKLTVNLTNQCSKNITVWYKFRTCNPYNFVLNINSSSSVIRSEYSIYDFDTRLTIPSDNYPKETCLLFRRKGVLRDCDVSTWAVLSVNARSPTGKHNFSYAKLDVLPISRTLQPAKQGSRKPSRRPTKKITRRPTKKTTRIPTKKPTRIPTKKTTRKPTKKTTRIPTKKITRKPTKKTTRNPTKKTTMKPTAKSTNKPTVKPTRKPVTPTNKPLRLPTRKPSKFLSSKPTALICGVVPSTRAAALTTLVQALSPSTNQSLSDLSSSESQALNWLIYQDGKKLCPIDVFRIRQRFIMATFYFSTGGDSTWVGCGRNSVKTCKINWSFVVDDPIKSIYGNKTWLSAADECEWGGIACNEATGTVDRIEFNAITSNKIGGTLPDEITLLTTMRFLIIEGCCSSSIPTYNATGFVGLSGKLPSNIGSIQSLRVLDLGYNLLSGTVPSSLLSIQNISIIDLNSNRFSGAFPSPSAGGPGTTAQLTRLQNMQLQGNLFTGSVPNLGSSLRLKNYTLQSNKFTGKVPDKVCTLRTGGGGVNATLLDLWADCKNNFPVQCTCCTQCF